MSRTATSSTFLTPVDSSGAPAVASSGSAFGETARGVFTLAVGTYYVPLGGADSGLLHAMMQGDATIAITSATIEETDLPDSEAKVYSDSVGQWIATPASIIESSVEGTGWTNTSDVGANSAGNQGGVAWNVIHGSAHRYRLKVVVGTQGAARFNGWGKE